MRREHRRLDYLPIYKDLRKRVRERVRGSDRARLTRISNSPVLLPEALKRRQGRLIVTWWPPGALLEALKTMNVLRIVAGGASWKLWDADKLDKSRLQERPQTIDQRPTNDSGAAECAERLNYEVYYYDLYYSYCP